MFFHAVAPISDAILEPVSLAAATPALRPTAVARRRDAAAYPRPVREVYFDEEMIQKDHHGYRVQTHILSIKQQQQQK